MPARPVGGLGWAGIGWAGLGVVNVVMVMVMVMVTADSAPGTRPGVRSAVYRVPLDRVSVGVGSAILSLSSLLLVLLLVVVRSTPRPLFVTAAAAPLVAFVVY